MRPATQLTNIVTAAADTDLTTLAAVKSELKIKGKGDDSWFGDRITSASAAIQKYCNRIFAVQTIQDRFWLARDSWPAVLRHEDAPLQLTNWPVISVTSVTATIAGVVTTLDENTDFLIDQENGQLIRLNAAGNPKYWRESPIAVVYAAGFATIPPDVAEAALLMVKMRFYGRTRDPLARSLNAPGVFEESFVMGTGPGGEDDMPAEVTAKLDGRYRLPVFA